MKNLPLIFFIPVLSIAQIRDTAAIKEIKMRLEKHEEQYSTGTSLVLGSTIGLIGNHFNNLK